MNPSIEPITLAFVGDIMLGSTFPAGRRLPPHDGARSLEGVKKTLSGAFFSSSQLAATVLCLGLFQDQISPVLVFYTLPAIQTSAFGMTLIRKNIVSTQFWSIAYSLELILVYLLWLVEYGNLHLLGIGILLYLFRRVCYSKYILWTVCIALESMFY